MALSKQQKLITGGALAVLMVGVVGLMAMSQPSHDAPKGAMAAAGGPGGAGGAGGRPPGGPGGGPGGPGGGRGAATQIDASPATPRTFQTSIQVPNGTLEPRERVVLTANAADQVTGVFFEDGQRVAKGKVLMTLVNEEEKAQLETAQANYDNARQVYERNKRLAADDAIAQMELDRTKSLADAAIGSVSQIQARLRDRILVAPFAGVLGFRQVSNGAYVSPGQPVATLIDDSQMRLEFGVPSIYVTALKPGLEIEAVTKDIPGRTFKGQLTSIDNAIDPISLAVKVRATLPNRDGALKAGMSMMVDLTSKEHTSLSVPEIAIIAEASKNFVFVVDQTRQPSVAVKTEVTLGMRERGTVEVLTGLHSGDMIVTDGVLKLRPNAPVKIKPAGPPKGGSGEPRLASGTGPSTGPSEKSGLSQ